MSETGLRLVTSSVISSWLTPLAQSHTWERLYIVSPWISQFDTNAGMRFETFARRIERERTTVYVLTRPPVDQWHAKALDVLAAGTRVYVATAPGLHTKLFTAETRSGEFGIFGSANLTARSLVNSELGVFVSGGFQPRFFSSLRREASRLYSSIPGRSRYT